MEVVAISQAPSPESNPNSPSPVISLVGPYPTINLIGQSFLWSIVLKGLPSSLTRLAVWLPQQHSKNIMQCLKVLVLSPIYPSSLLHKRMSSTMTTTCPHAQVPPICPRCHSLLQANCVTTIHSHKLLFLLLPGLLSHTPSSTLSIVVTLSRPCPVPFPRQENKHTNENTS